MANRYWVGGTANWDATAGTKWALTSGGAGGQAVPTATDAVFLDAASGAVTVTINTVGAICLSIDCTGFTGTLAGNSSQFIDVWGSLTFSAGMTYTFAGTLSLFGTGTITSAGKTFNHNITINNVGITSTLNGNLSGSPTNTLTLTRGTLDLAGFTLSVGSFASSNLNTRSIAFGTGNIVLLSTTAAALVLNMASATGFTFTGTGGFTRNMAATATVSFGNVDGGSTTNAPNLTVNGGASALAISNNSYFKNLIFTGSTSTVTVSILNMAGNLTLASGGTYTAVVPTFVASGTITSATKTLGNTTVNGTGITVTLADAMTVGIANTTTLTEGTLALAGFTLSTGIFSSSGSTTRAITFGVGNIALTSTTAATTVLSMSIATGFTCTGTGGFTRNMAATATIVFGTTGGSTANAPNLTVNAGASALTITANSWFQNVIFTGSTCTVSGSAINIAGNLTLATGGTFVSFSTVFVTSATVTSVSKSMGSITVNGSGITVTLADALTTQITSQTNLTAGTLNLAGFTLSTGAFQSTNTNTRAITFGAGNIALTSTTAATTLISMATATGFTWTGTGGFTRNMAATGTVSFGSTAGGSTTNAPNLTVNAGASALSITASSYFKNVIFTGSTCTVTASGLNMAGNLTLASGGTYTAVVPTFLASGTITSVTKTLGNTAVNGSGITVTLADAMTLGSTNTLTLTQGTFTAANFNVTAGLFSSSNSNTRTLNMGSGTWTISGSGATAWDTATTTGMTLNPSTSTITMTSASAKTFAGGGLTYYNLNQGGAGTLTISGSNTFNNITNTVQPNTVTFTAGTTQTVSNFSLSGTVGNLITINSATPGTQATLSKSSGTINAQYLSIKDSNATGGAVWNAQESTNAGNNTGWNIFAGQENMFLMFP
jgi:hypothetical protein